MIDENDKEAAYDADSDPLAAAGDDAARELDTHPAHGVTAAESAKAPLWRRLVWEGGFAIDGFLTAASAQVGQVVLNLPNSMAKLSLAGGIVVQLYCAGAAVWTLFLLVALYHELKRDQLREGRWYDAEDENGKKRRAHVTQYHTVITHTSGRVLGEFARCVNIAKLVGVSVAQIIASASNFYLLGTGLSKRDFTFIFGAIALGMVLVPSFQNMRIFAFLALAGTTYTSWYMMAESWRKGLTLSAAALPPPSRDAFFQGFSNVVFTFGGHCMLLEVVDSQFKPSRFPRTFADALAYVTATLTLPNAAFAFLAFPKEALANGNAFQIFPHGAARSVGIVLMVAHQLVAFGMFILPVCVMWEKLVRTHRRGLGIKLASRVPVGLLVWFIALLVPFFGVVNNLLGAFCVSFETYLVPCFAWCWYFRTKERRDRAVLKPFMGWPLAYAFNIAIILTMSVGGLGFGGYSSVVALVEAIGTFGVFAKCYECH